jgi:WW domain-binding protein 2
LVFVSSAFGQPGSFDTFSVQLLSLLSIQYQQPYFASNYIALDVKPAPGGGLTEGAKAELRLKDKGIFELFATLEKSREHAFYKQRDEMLNVSELREYKDSSFV